MGALPLKELSCGKIKAAVWRGEYEGKTTYSVTFNKSYFDQKTKEYKDSKYYTPVDLRDLYVLVTKMVQGGVKERIPGQKENSTAQPAEEYTSSQVAESLAEDLEVPF